MVVEVKTQLSVSLVEHRLKRLQLLRRHDSGRLRGKTILAAVIGLNIDKDADDMASRLGMHVIETGRKRQNITVKETIGGVGKR